MFLGAKTKTKNFLVSIVAELWSEPHQVGGPKPEFRGMINLRFVFNNVKL
jgi:hypothetical protein